MQEINTRKRDRAEIVLDLFEMYHDRVYAFARKSAEPAVAEDATQEAFVRLLQHPRLEELDISISYLLKIVHNILRRRFTRSVRLREIVEEKIKPRIRQNEEDSSPQPLRVAEHFTNLGQVEQAFGRLSPDERDALRMIVCEGKSYAHAARSLGVSVTTINNWKHRGLSKLRGQLESEGRGGRGHAPARHSRSA
ncbi:MAG: sigma-70 family RNA polymerase sigma factor [Planctomycetia bacterium]|nr:sigma-70 family RNA polymerase sigma factor [Planctomycetia bacterium]